MMSKQVYFLEYAKDFELFQKRINLLLDAGSFLLHGSTFVSDLGYTQAIIRLVGENPDFNYHWQMDNAGLARDKEETQTTRVVNRPNEL